jgi:hypothetical protein
MLSFECYDTQTGAMCLGDQWSALLDSDQISTPEALSWAAEYDNGEPRVQYANNVHLSRKSVCNLIDSVGWLDDEVRQL